MIEALGFEFMQNALIAGILVSLISGIIGSLIVSNRMVFLVGGIAHAAYGGIGLAIFYSLPMFFGTSLFAIAAALLMAFITINQKDKIDVFIGLIWAVGMAIGIILVDLSPGYNVDLMSYLFGSILAVNSEDLVYMGVLLTIILAVLLFWYHDILAVSYDSDYASIVRINIKFFYTLILVLSALSVVVAIKVVGLILVIALLTIPIYIAQNLTSSLSTMMLTSGLVATFFTLVGLWFSYHFDLTSGACIILVSAVGLTLFMFIKRLAR
jgi:zinc transport system permease protein